MGEQQVRVKTGWLLSTRTRRDDQRVTHSVPSLEGDWVVERTFGTSGVLAFDPCLSTPLQGRKIETGRDDLARRCA